MRKIAAFACSVLLSTAAIPQGPPSDSLPVRPRARLVEKEFMISIPNAFPGGVDALEVYEDLPGRHPLAVLTHGTSNNPEVRAHLTPWAQLQQALWFARRGYVAIVVIRRGYGRSGGEQDGHLGGCGSRRGSNYESIGENSADDLRGVIKFAAGLPEADTGTIISAGVSTGGFAQAALVAHPPAGLKAAISFAGGRGGDGHEHNCDLDGVTGAFSAFGKDAHKHGSVPMLWIYSENDHWFPPAMARRFEAAYTKGGGVDQFVLAPPDGDDGHHLYAHVAAWSDIVEAFLKTHDLLPLGEQLLPGPVVADFPAPAGLPPEGAHAWTEYLEGAPFKAFATDGKNSWGLAQAAFDQQIADKDAMDRCRKQSNKGGCQIVARPATAK